MALKPTDTTNPLQWRFQVEGGRTAQPSDLSTKHVAVLEEAAKKIQHPLLRARIYDLLWLRAKGSVKFDSAKLAIGSYLESVQLDGESVGDYEIICGFERACRLWVQLNRPTELKDLILSTFSTAFDFNKPEPSDFSRFHYMKTAVICRIHDDNDETFKRLDALEEASVDQNHFRKAREYLNLGVSLAGLLKLEDRKKDYVTRETDLYGFEARKMKAAGMEPSPLANLFGEAISANQEANKILGNRQSEIEGHVRRLVETRRASGGLVI